MSNLTGRQLNPGPTTHPNFDLNTNLYFTAQGAPAWHAEMLYRALQEAERIARMDRTPYTQQRVATLSDQFKKAQQELEDSISARKNDPRAQLIAKEVEKARASGPHSLAKKFIEEAATDPAHYIEDYMGNFRKNVIAPYKEEVEEDWLEKTYPSINAKYAISGSFHGGQRHTEIAKARASIEKARNREILRMMQAGHEQAQEHLHKRHSRKLSEAELTGNLASKEAEQATISANLLSNLSAKEQLAKKIERDERREYGSKQEAHQQEKLNRLYEQHLEEQDHPSRQLGQYLEAIRGTPHPGMQSISGSKNPTPPPINQPAQAASALSQAAGFLGLKKGGRVKRAAGGHNLLPQYSDEQLPAMKNEDMENILAIGNEIRHTGVDPRAAGLLAMGSTMGQHLGSSSPWQAFSAGSADYLNTHHAATESRTLNKIRAANIYDKIQESRIHQHKLLAEHDFRMKEFEEQQRLHNSQISLNKAHEDYYSKKHSSALVKIDRHNQKILEQVSNEASSAPELLGDLDRLEVLAGKINSGQAGSDNSVIGNAWVAGKLPKGMGGQGEQADLEEFDKIAADFVVKATRAFGARGGVKIAQMIEKSKPSRSVSSEANLRNIAHMKEQISEKLKEADFINDALDSGITPTKAQNIYSRYRRVKAKDPKADPYAMAGIHKPEREEELEEAIHEEENLDKSASQNVSSDKEDALARTNAAIARADAILAGMR